MDSYVITDGFLVGHEIKLWQNGDITTVVPESSKATPSALFVSGDDVYISGAVQSSDGLSHAAYWKNGELKTLSEAESYSNDIFVFNDDIYVCGYEYDSVKGVEVAKYWKNGDEVVLSDGTTSVQAEAIFVAH